MRCTLGEIFKYLSKKYMIDLLHFFRDSKGKGGVRYIDLFNYLHELGASSRTISMRLNELLKDDILIKKDKGFYCLTDKGEELISCLKSLHVWQEKYVIYGGNRNGK